MSTDNRSMFDKDEQSILDTLVEEGELPGSTVTEIEPTEAVPAEVPPVAQAVAQAEPVAAVDPAPTAPTEPAVATPAEPAPPQGDTRAALRASRRAEKRLRDELDALRQENDDLKQGKAPVDASITDAELAELEEEFPLQAKVVRKQRELEEQLRQQSAVRTQPAESEFVPRSYDPAIQDVIDGVPDLMTWQFDEAAQDKFERAIQYDAALLLDPDWKARTPVERFAEAARRTKAAMEPAHTPTQVAPAATPRIDPAQAIAAAPSLGPKGISDFRGGAPAAQPALNYPGMTDEQIMASLPIS